MIISGVEIKPITREILLDRVKEILQGAGGVFYHLVSINPEFIVEAARNDRFKQVLNNADFTLVDGVGLLGAMHYEGIRKKEEGRRRKEEGKGKGTLNTLYEYGQLAVSCIDVGLLRSKVVVDGVVVERITGVDFVQELVRQEWMKGKRVFLLGGKEGVAEKAAGELKKLNGDVEFGWSEGHVNIRSKIQTLQDQNQDEESRQLIDAINTFKPDVLFVAYGHPWQDLWIDQVKGQLPTVRIAMGVGGAFDYISGEIVRAPQWMQDVGLEWVYRLFKQPQRFERIVNATWRFVRLVVR